MGHTPEPHRADWVGRVLDGRYQVESVIGEGGMGVTYLASDRRQFGRHVAIKVPHEEVLATRTFRDRFSQEIKQLIAREHPNIVKLYDSGDLNGIPYAVLQHLPGGSLRTRMQRVVPPSDVMKWLPAIADALDFIHGKVLHRDVKPENILFDAEGHAYLVDFGIAKVFSDPMLVTKTGAILGSPPYMAPEVATGKRLGPAYDQYALAVVVYEALSGQWPHESSLDDFSYLVQKATQPARPLRRLSPGVPANAADAVMKALSTDPRHRFESCRHFATAFAEGTSSIGAKPLMRPAAGISAVLATVLVAILAWTYLPPALRQEPDPVTTPSASPARDTATVPSNSDAAERVIEAKWRDYQSRMEQTHATLLEEDGAARTAPAQKAVRWRDFLSEFGADNPATVADDTLRAAARERLLNLEREAAVLLKPAPAAAVNPSTRRDVPLPSPPAREEAPLPVPPVGVAAGESKVAPARETRPAADSEPRRENAEAIRELLLRGGQSLERADYESAVKAYEAALALDANSIAAREGLERSRRAQDAEARVLRRLTEPD